MRTQRPGSRRPTMAVLSAIVTLLAAAWAPAQDPGDSAAEANERKVMERFLTVLEKTPRRGTALDRVYGYHVEHGSLDALVRRYDDRTKADPKDGAAWLLLGLIEAQRGRDAAAVAALREAERARPDDSLPPFYLGQALVLVGQPDTAVDAFERALGRRPIRSDLLEMYQALGRVHQRARRSDKALAVWARLEASFPDDTRVREQIAAALAEEDQPAQALIRYEKLARDVKDDYRKVQMALEAAELKVRLGRAPEALADFERLLTRLNPDAWLFREVRRKIEEVFLRNDDLAGLARYYEAWIARTPDDVEAMARLGRTLAQLGRAAESRGWLDKAVKLAPSRRDLRLALIEQLIQEKKTAEASAQYEALAKAEPGNPDIVRDWGRLLLRDTSRPEPERKAAAAAVWRRLAGEGVKDPVAIAQAADLFRQAEMVDEAIGLYRRAIALAPDSAQYREYLGEYYHQLKRPADALATWRTGVGKAAAEQGRLGEVLAGFGYRKEALDPLTEAVRLAPDDFDLRLKLADLLVQLDRPLDGLKELAAAAKSADGAEQAEAVLAREIHAYQAANTLAAQVAGLKADLDAGKAADAPRWTRLARYYESDGKPAEAVGAAARATAVDPRSLVAWTTLGRLEEASGNLASAAAANRTLATLDRRNRADYLAAIARLEARLGRKDEALKAGRELLAAAPGNVEHHQEFAELCFNLGEIDEGLEALRRASRANPSDPKATNTLADALARQFRTEEAIELFWRSFDRTKELEAKLAVVARLAEQYLQRNQFDRLIARLERELREPERKRELTICLAQAYQSAGDLATARQGLESLLAANTRDTGLLTQLANLAEAEGDVASSARYMKQVVDLTPSPDATQRLAGLYLKAGEVSEAEAVWSKLASGDGDVARAFSAVDSLLGSGKNETVLTLTERMLLKRPNDWDALYREGVALTNLSRPADAARRFRAILDQRTVNDDDLAAIPKSKKKGAGSAARPAGVAGGRMAGLYQYPLYQRTSIVYQIRSAVKLDNDRYYGGGVNTVWTPTDFGQARMAALGWLYAASLKEKDPDAWFKDRRAEVDRPQADPRTRWDWYYLELIRSEPREIFAAAVRLARALPTEPTAQYAFLTALGARATASNLSRRYYAPGGNASKVDKTPPLPEPELALVLDGFEALRKRRPDLIHSQILSNVGTELKRSKREKEEAAFYKSAVDAANTLESVAAVLAYAGERGDVDGLLAMAEKHERLQGAPGTSPPASRAGGAEVAQAIARAMGVKAETKDHAAILRMLDHHLTAARRPDQVARRIKAKSTSGGSSNQNYYQVYLSKAPNSRYTQIDFPTPNPYFDFGSILVLRNAFDVYKRDDLASDLVAHFRAEAAKLPAEAKLFPTLAAAYLLWWADDKDEAIKEYNRATDLARNDVELRLSLADLRAQRGEPAEALEAADSVEPLDQKTMQRRELLALRLSVLSGDVGRARKASERLFGLRLDGDTQVQLATQMNQLGMHDLAEAVLARARRRAGGNNASLVALMLQYQKQGKADVAVQVANQILRQSTGARQTQPGYYNENDQARTEAVQVFARSGKLKELIARAELQLAASPGSIQLLQTLVDYYQADNQRDKVKATYERMAKLRPDDARLRFQIAMQIHRNGAAAESLGHFEAALKKEPSLFANSYWQVQQAYQAAGKTDDLVKLYEAMDFKTFQSNPYIIQNTISQLFQDDKTRPQGLALFRKAWKDMPDSRAGLLSGIYNDDVWKLPEIYDYAREAIIPPANKPIVDAWSGLDQIDSYGQNGTVNGVMTRLLEASTRQGKLDTLAADVAAAVGRSPDWVGGRALLAVLKARRGKADEARKELEPILADGSSIPVYARMIVGQELDKVEALRDVELRIYEGAVADGMDEMRGNGFQYGPGKRLALLYQKAGRSKDAREFVLKYSKTPNNWNGYDPSYASYQKINEYMGFASLMQELGYPADAARFYSEVANDTDAINNARMYYGNTDQITNMVRDGIARSMQGTDRVTVERTLRTLVTPRPDARPGEPILDLVLLCYPRELDKAAVTCLFAEAVKTLKDHPQVDAEVRESVAKLAAAHPDDLSVLAAAAILAAADGKAESLAPAAERLARRIEAMPLDPLPTTSRANARQREEASRQLLAWVVARECVKHDATRSVGEALAARALDAARRQSENRWSLAMLRETSQVATDRGDRPAAEAALRAMLRIVLANPSPTKAARPTPAPAPAAAVAKAATAPAPAPPPAAPPALPAGTSVIVLDRFEQAAQLARLAANRGMPGLSIDAMTEALAAGPPVTPIAINNPNQARMMRMNNPGADPVAQRVEEQMFALEAAWSRAKLDPAAVYGVLRDAVLPKARPQEIFLYARPLAMGNLRRPRSVGALLVRWATKAGKADELASAIEARQAGPLAVAPAQVLRAQLALERKDLAGASKALGGIRDGLVKNGLAVTGEQACHAALPALDVKEAATAAAGAIEAALPRIASPNAEEPIGGLLIRMARHRFAHGQPAEAKAHLIDFLAKMQASTSRYGGDYGIYRRRVHIARIAGEFARAGRLDDALDQLGQYADAPTTTDYGDGGGIAQSLAQVARLLAPLSAADRYARLEAWTLPTAERKSVRWVVEVAADARPPSPFPGPKPASDRGIVATPLILIEAAREAGTLDALADRVKLLADQKVENAAKLLAQVDLARGRAKEATSAVRARAEDLAKNPPEPSNNRFGRAKGLDWSDYLLAQSAIASGDADLAAVGEDLTLRLLAASKRTHNASMLGMLRRDLAEAQARRAGAPEVALVGDPGLALWAPRAAVGRGAGDPARARGRDLWAESSGVLAHITGAGPGYLVMRYPIAGSFEVSVDAYNGNYAEGQLGYGGLVFEPNESAVRGLGFNDRVSRPGNFSGPERFNRMTVRVAPGKVRYLINNHLFYEDSDPSPTSPWLVLQGSNQRHTAFRNPTISGRVEIPREVALSHADRLDGWDSSTFYETTPPRRSVGEVTNNGNRNGNGQAVAKPTKLDDFDWWAKDGEIRGRRLEATAGGGSNFNTFNSASLADAGDAEPVVRSRLAYLRPLADGESISYEFYYEPGETAVHPGLGRLAFLIEPEGVRLLALTPPGEVANEPDAKEILDDPAGRREAVSLRPAAWNAATVRLRGETISVEVNGKVVYERAADPEEDRVFSLFHDKSRTAARARNVVLRGDWPRELTPDQSARLFARAEPNDTGEAGRARRRARAAMIGENLLELSAGDVARNARSLPPADRYAALLAWVLPSDDHTSIRLVGEFGPTDPPSPATPPPTGSRVPVPPALASPAIDLVAAAAEAKTLDALADAVDRAEAPTPLDRRGRLALLALVRDAQGRTADAEAALRALRDGAKAAIQKDTPDLRRWPELIAGSALAPRPGLNPAATALLAEVVEVIQRDGTYSPIERHFRSARDVARLLGKDGPRPALGDDPRLAGWVRGTIGTAESKGVGYPLPTWTYRDGTWSHTAGHHNDLMFLAAPLRGDFEVSCELTSFGWRESRISYGVTAVGLKFDLKSYEVKHYGREVTTGVIDPPFKEVGDWYPFRLVVKGGQLTAFAAGRKIYEGAVTAENDPWLAIYAPGNLSTGVRNLKVAGRPTVPDRLGLSTGSDLTGWIGDYYGEPTQGENAAWQKRGDEIVGRLLKAEAVVKSSGDLEDQAQTAQPETTRGSKQEGLIRYARPLSEDAEFEYEFYYEPGKSLVHPSLGRLAFLLGPDGVKVHRITDGRFDRTGIDPANAADEPASRRGPAALALRPKAWNRAVLTLKGDTLALAINGEPAFERRIEPTNQREVGFFHYADETEARVRNVTLRGDWPRAIPADVVDRPATASAR